ncbi:hypothetical protein B0T17DRAFT_402764 [Bombardia bombarda]|uniref:Uncharacterized protein n=1 Tax=Bombardia bombarda TaxID=252184 RepID=A0AA39T266_9PEZI|nr:hypothetical protein B0T17DRAFT_402764 [Bombardia bombarda]
MVHRCQRYFRTYTATRSSRVQRRKKQLAQSKPQERKDKQICRLKRTYFFYPVGARGDTACPSCNKESGVNKHYYTMWDYPLSTCCGRHSGGCRDSCRECPFLNLEKHTAALLECDQCKARIASWSRRA